MTGRNSRALPVPRGLRDEFEELEYTAVYLMGPEAGRPVRIGWASNPGARVMEAQTYHWRPVRCHYTLWTPGKPIAQRIVEEAGRLLDKRKLRNEWFDITVELAVGATHVAAQN